MQFTKHSVCLIDLAFIVSQTQSRDVVAAAVHRAIERIPQAAASKIWI